jgi:hypothetical protein
MSSVFDDKSAKPDQAALDEVLGETSPLFGELLAFSEEVKPGLKREWKFYGKKHGWQLKVFDRKRAALYLIPHEGSFLAGMALRPAAVEAVKASNLPRQLIDEITSAKAYREGAPARVEVHSAEHVVLIKELMRLKLTS